jgi:sterol 3beta-glucosyltransferase
VVCPFVADQPFWARRAHDLGVALAPVPQRRLDSERLAAALDLALTDPAIRTTAAELGHRIRDERGAAAAAAQLETLVLDGASR